MSSEQSGRRRFLTLASGAIVGSVVGCGSPTSGAEPEPFGDAGAGLLADLPEGTLRPVDGAPALIGRDAGGLYAMTSTCTHEGCDLNHGGWIDGAGVHCGCHGAAFNLNGAKLSGPAEGPLAHFAVSVDAAGAITVHGASRVAASLRTAVV